MRRLAGLVAFGVTVGYGAMASAGVIAWGPATGISGDSDVYTTGTTAGAYNVGPTGVAATTINGVAFAPFAVTGDGATAGNFQLNSRFAPTASSVAPNGDPALPYTGLSAAYRAMLGTALRTGISEGNTPDYTLTMSNLTVGQAYAFQFWVNYSRPSGADRSSITATGSDGGSVTVVPNTDSVDGGVGQFAVGTFTATAATQAITFSGQVNIQPGGPVGTGPILNGFQLRAIPEPAGIALCGTLAGLALARRRVAR